MTEDSNDHQITTAEFSIKNFLFHFVNPNKHLLLLMSFFKEEVHLLLLGF